MSMSLKGRYLTAAVLKRANVKGQVIASIHSIEIFLSPEGAAI